MTARLRLTSSRTRAAHALVCAFAFAAALVTFAACEERDAYERADESEEVASATSARARKDGEELRRGARLAVDDLDEAARRLERGATDLAEDLDRRGEEEKS